MIFYDYNQLCGCLGRVIDFLVANDIIPSSDLHANMNNYNFFMIDEISLVSARRFNVINNRLRSIKHIQNNFFSGVNVIMIGDFYQTPPMKGSWIFQNMKYNVNN